MEAGWKEDGGKMEGVWRENRWRMMEDEIEGDEGDEMENGGRMQGWRVEDG
jgi:hypothetical protein